MESPPSESPPEDRDAGAEESDRQAGVFGDSTVDEMGMGSFPASDPPAVWTWEPRASAADAGTKRRGR